MASGILNALNSDQRKAAKHTHGPSIILAGAGSGKTRVLTFRAAYLIVEKNVPPQSILMCTFTNKAAQEMRDRMITLVREYSSLSLSMLPYSGTFHSFCAHILRIDGGAIGIPRTYGIYDTSDQISAVKESMKKLQISEKKVNPQAVLHTISEAKNELISPSQYLTIARGYFQETVASIYGEYQKLLQTNEALDFDDLLLYSVRLFRNYPDILGKYQERFSYIHIDEYQDTNKAQYELSTLLSARHRNICIVGDASQSIYKWRGADFRNILNFKKDFPDAEEFHLEQNYRSTQTVLDAAYAVISQNTSHPVLKLWTDNEKGEKITLYEARNEHDEATYLIQTILQSGRDFSDFAVLYRTNAQSRVLEEALLHAGIPYTLIGGIRFYERKEIKDVLSYLRLIVNPKDTVSHRRIEKLGKRRAERFFSWMERKKDEALLVSYSTLELMDMLLDATDYLSLYDADSQDGQSRLENIKELRSVATEFPAIHEFLTNVALVQQEYGLERKMTQHQNSNAVTLMTMHAAKGLEFSHVCIVGMEEGLFPHSRSLMDREELEEERRLCYVALTRAKHKLYLTYARKRLFFGTRTQNMVSRFLADIPESVIDYQASLSSYRGFAQEDLLL